MSGPDEKLILALLTEPTIGSAAKKAGVSERTLYRRLSEPDFKAALRDSRRNAIDLATGLLQQGAGEAVLVLRLVSQDTAAPASARVAAAKSVLDLAYKAAELDDVLTRLDAVEAKLAETAAAPLGLDGKAVPR